MIKLVYLIVVFLVAGCAEPPNPDRTFRKLKKGNFNTIAVTTTDFTTSGALSLVHLTEGRIETQVVPHHLDAIVRSPEGSGAYFILERMRGSIIEVDKVTRSITNFSVGGSTNPQDMLLYKGWIYVSALNSDKLLRVKRSDPLQQEYLPIDFSDYTIRDPYAYVLEDPYPEMASMALVGSQILLSIQKLERLSSGFMVPTDKSVINVIDTQTQSRRKVIELKKTNPFSDFKQGPDSKLYLGEMGKYGELDGGIEAFHTDPIIASAGLVITEAELEGNILDFEILTPKRGIAIVEGLDFRTKLVLFNPETQTKIKVLLDRPPQVLAALLVDRERDLFFVSDRDMNNPAIRTFNSKTLREDERLRFDVGLPPYQMVLSE